ncbi:MAG: DUF192 domain-containing protein [bacterium]|nr:DUF192 domain-containing protein [bacterium]
MKIKLLLLIFSIASISLFLFPPRLYTPKEKNNGEKIIKLGRAEITVEVADTEWERSQGLSGRTSLLRNQGMLFVFPQKSRYSFWMSDMKFPLDFIWIDGYKVVEITYDVPYPKNGESPITIAPKAPADKVLEVNAGVASAAGVKVGDQIGGL